MVHLKQPPARIVAGNLGQDDRPTEEEAAPGAATEHELLVEAIKSSGGATGRIQFLLAMAQELGFDPDDPDIMHRAILAGHRSVNRELATLTQYREERLAREPLVYYMRMSQMVKIGFTTHLAARLEVIVPQEVVAVEFGAAKLEKARHRQFAGLRSHGEWFHLDAKLEQHIRYIRGQFEQQVGQPFGDWLASAAPRYVGRLSRDAPS